MFKDMNYGLWIAIEGIDNVGKTTLVEALVNKLTEKELNIRLEPEFGNLEFGQFIQTLVYSNWGCVPTAAQPYVIAADRAHRYLEALEFSKKGGTVIFDRHLMTSAIYQGVALKRSTSDMWSDLRKLYNSRFIKPDLTLILDTSIETVVERGGDDIQTIQFLTEARERYIEESKVDGVILIDAEQPKHLVFESALKIIGNELAI